MNGGFMKRRTLIIIASITAGVLVLAGAGIWGGVAYATGSAQHDLDVANTALSKARTADAVVVKQLTADRAAASKLVASVRPLVAATEELLDGAARAKVGATLDQLGATAAKTDVAKLTTGPVKPKDGSLGAVQAAVRAARVAVGRDKDLALQNRVARDLLAGQVDAVETAVRAAAKTAPAVSATLLAANPRADAAVRDAFAKQATAVGAAVAGKDVAALIAAISDYAGKGKAVIDSQAAVIAAEQKAAAEAPAQHGGGSAGSAGGGSDVGGSGSTGGGGGGGALSASTPPAGAPGGVTPTPPITQPRGQVVLSGSCVGAGGAATGNWTSNLVAPTNALNIGVTFEHPGDSWGISWTCDTGW